MTTTIDADVSTLTDAAASAAAAALTLGEPVTTTGFDNDTEFAAAVSVQFTGARSGRFAILVDAQLLDDLGRSGTAPGDLSTSLAPAIGAVAQATGLASTGVPQVLEVAAALALFASHPESASAALRGANRVRAAVLMSMDPRVPGGLAPEAISLERLDLLRGVEMQASAELGRSRMTINELLNLRPGAVVDLDRAAGDPADLYVNGRLIARGEVVVVDENYALRITQIVTDDKAR